MVELLVFGDLNGLVIKPLCDLFPELFAKEALKEVLIYERLQGNGQDRVWNWSWLQQLSYTESQQLEALKGLLYDFFLNSDIVDRWKWKPGLLGIFSVSSCYSVLIESHPIEELEAILLAAIKKLWRVDVPSKFLVFGWRLILDRLPTRSALNHRGILLNHNDLSCVFYSLNVEDRGHLFFGCQFTLGVWTAISNWIGKIIRTGLDCYDHFLMFGNLVRTKKGGRRVSRLIWLVAMWSIWKMRNDVIFKGVTPDATTIINEIKSISWLWFSCRFGCKANLSFLYWCVDHLDCFANT
jgi:hypothetical protein